MSIIIIIVGFSLFSSSYEYKRKKIEKILSIFVGKKIGFYTSV